MSVAEKLAIVEENVPKVYQAGYAKGMFDGSSVTAVYPKDVNFYDYEGTLLHSYTVEEAQLLTELPELPEREGLICQGWNYDLETIKSCNRTVDVGATYITDDGKTRLYIRIESEDALTVPLYFTQTVNNGVVIDWGDGSTMETLDGTGKQTPSHTYASRGDYVISLEVANGGLRFGHGDYSCSLMDGSTTTRNSHILEKVEIGNGVTSLDNYSFRRCYRLSSITIPNSVTSMAATYPQFNDCRHLSYIVLPRGMVNISKRAFESCKSLSSISIPDTVTSIGENAFYECKSLSSISIPNGVLAINPKTFYTCSALKQVSIPNGCLSIGDNAFYECTSLGTVTLPNSVNSIDNMAFYQCNMLTMVDFTSYASIPTAGSNAFGYISTVGEIRIPASLYDEWIAATNWSNFAERIVAV